MLPQALPRRRLLVFAVAYDLSVVNRRKRDTEFLDSLVRKDAVLRNRREVVDMRDVVEAFDLRHLFRHGGCIERGRIGHSCGHFDIKNIIALRQTDRVTRLQHNTYDSNCTLPRFPPILGLIERYGLREICIPISHTRLPIFTTSNTFEYNPAIPRINPALSWFATS